MLSNTADRKPKSAVGPRGRRQPFHRHHRRREHQCEWEHAAADRLGHDGPVRRRSGAVSRIIAATVTPMNGKRSASGEVQVDHDVDGDRGAQDQQDDQHAVQSSRTSPTTSRVIGAWRCCRSEAGIANTRKATPVAT